MQRFIGKVVEIRPGEGRLVALLLLLSACIGAARSTITTASVAIFFDRYDASVLPYTYIGSAAIVSAAGYLYSRLEGRFSFAALLTGTMTAIAFYLGLLRLSLVLEADWPAFAVAVSNEVVWVLSGLVYWGLAGRLMDVRQSKRLFGLIGSGEVAAMVLAGALTPLLVGMLGNDELVSTSAAGIALGTLLLAYVMRAYHARITEGEEESASTEPAPPARQRGDRLRDPYLWLIILFSALCQITYYFVDTGYVTEANAQFPEPEAMASFLGVFWAGTYAVTFLTRVLVVGPMLTRMGVGFQLLVTPISIGLGVLSVALVGNVAGQIPLLFWLVCLSKLLIEICWDSIYGPAKLILLQPLPARLRLWTQTVVEGIAEPVAQGGAGVILLLYALFVPLTGVTLANASLPLVVAFAVIGVFVGRRYVLALRAAVARRHVGDVTLSLSDQATLDALEHGLQSEKPAQVLYCLGKLVDAGHPRLDTLLLSLLAHQQPQVREEALLRIERLRVVADVLAILTLLEKEQEARVRAAALRVLCALQPEVSYERAGPALDDRDPIIRMGALEGLLRHGSGESLRAAEDHLRELAIAPEPETRAFAAEAMGEVGFTRTGWPLTALMQDAEPIARRAALAAAGKVKEPDYWPAVIHCLGSIQTSRSALAALADGGTEAVPFIAEAVRRPDVSLKVHLNALTACGRIGGDRAIALLERQLKHPSVEVRQQALRALSAAGYNLSQRNAGDAVALTHSLLAKEVEICCWALAADADVQPDTRLPMHIDRALAIEQELSKERIFLLLSFIYDRESIERARANYASDTQDRRANAVELLDTVIGHEHKQLVLPLVEDLEPEERLKRLHGRFPQKSMSAEGRLVDVATRPTDWITPWTRACALHALVFVPSAAATDVVRAALLSSEPITFETAQWAIARLPGMEPASLAAEPLAAALEQ